MTTTVQAIYEEEGILRLLSPLELEKGTQVKLTVDADVTQSFNRRELTEEEMQVRLEMIQSLNALAVTHGRLETASRDHDEFLYGPEGAR